MKIALVLDRFDPSLGGLERWAFELVRWLSNAAHEVHVVASEFSEPSPVPAGHRHRLAGSLGRLERAAAAAEVVRSLAADVVHDTGTGWDFDVFHPHSGSRLADRRADLRAEAWYRRPLRAVRLRLHGRDRFALERRQLGAGRGVIVACSRMVRDDLERLHGVDPARIRVVPNGVDTD
ncbi:MAG: glycosyltransferase family 4 protein, partial [Candidatus Binatia bacterium]